MDILFHQIMISLKTNFSTIEEIEWVSDYLNGVHSGRRMCAAKTDTSILRRVNMLSK